MQIRWEFGTPVRTRKEGNATVWTYDFLLDAGLGDRHIEVWFDEHGKVSKTSIGGYIRFEERKSGQPFEVEPAI